MQFQGGDDDENDHFRPNETLVLKSKGSMRSSQTTGPAGRCNSNLAGSEIQSYRHQSAPHARPLEANYQQIDNLAVGATNVTVIGVVAAIQEPREMPDQKNPGNPPRGVIGFTLRDSINSLINISCWGSASWCETLTMNELQVDSIGKITELAPNSFISAC